MKKSEFKLFTRFRVKGQTEEYVVSGNDEISEAETGKRYALYSVLGRSLHLKVWIGVKLFGKLMIVERLLKFDELELAENE